MSQSASQSQDITPTLLRQIVDEVDALSETAKAEVLRKIKMQQAIELARKADEAMEGKFKPLSEDEIAEMVSKNRKERYEKKVRD
jgi:hypothetical protein